VIALFYLSAAVAIVATVLVITRSNAAHAVLYLIVSLLAVALVFYALGAPFAAALEVIIYAGAIMVLFVFVVMILNLGAGSAAQERNWLHPAAWTGPTLLAAVLAGELFYLLVSGRFSAAIATQGTGAAAAQLAGAATTATAQPAIEPKQVGLVLFGPYLLAVELASMLLLAGLVAAYHLGRELLKQPQQPAASLPQRLREQPARATAGAERRATTESH
jgi:NADH-quinone oxidoreductase subunit J